MSEFWINFLVIPRSDYLNEMRKLLIVMQKKKVKTSIDSQNVKFWKISSGHNNKMGAKDDGKVKTYKNTNSIVCESKKGEKFMG